jgi:ParB family chromosome partitioning protein
MKANGTTSLILRIDASKPSRQTETLQNHVPLNLLSQASVADSVMQATGSFPYTYTEIPVDSIEVGTEQVRHRVDEEGINELATNIAKIGLLNPVTVYGPNSDKKYTLIAGQRRLMAVKKLGWEKVPVKIVPPMDEIRAKATSFAENMIREDLSGADTRATVVWLYSRFGSAKAIAEATGIPYRIVLEHVKYDTLDENLKKLVDQGAVDVKDAVKAQNASYAPDGSLDVNKAVKIAKEMPTLLGDQKQALIKKAEEMPEATADQLVEEAKKPEKNVTVYKIRLYAKESSALKKAAEEIEKSEEETAAYAVTTWLESQGYMS